MLTSMLGTVLWGTSLLHIVHIVHRYTMQIINNTLTWILVRNKLKENCLDVFTNVLVCTYISWIHFISCRFMPNYLQ